MREKAGIKDSVHVELEEGKIVIKAESLLGSLALHPIEFTTKDLSRLRKMAFASYFDDVQSSGAS